MLYSESELSSVGKQMKILIIAMSSIIVVFFGLAIAFLLRKPQWIGAAFISVGVSIAVYILCIYLVPVLSYYNFIKDIVEGRNRDISGRVTKVVREPVYKDNKLFFYEVWIVDSEDNEERVLLYDENKGLPDIAEGQNVTFKIHETFITDIVK